MSPVREQTLILASASPRRRMLLAAAGYRFAVRPRPVEESLEATVSPAVNAHLLAGRKADAARDLATEGVVLTADTIVVQDGEIFGKPRDRDEAVGMLSRLAAGSHSVITAVAVSYGPVRLAFAERTLVRFFGVGVRQVERYVDAAAPYDKAGAYGIQEWPGSEGRIEIVGDYDNVVGLPVARLRPVLARLGIVPEQARSPAGRIGSENPTEA